jgi:hypothetical protein
VEGSDDHERDLHGQEEADDHYQHHGGAVGVTLLAVTTHRHPAGSPAKSTLLETLFGRSLLSSQ